MCQSESESLRKLSYFFLSFANLSKGLPKEANLVIERDPRSSASNHYSYILYFRSSEIRPSINFGLPLKVAVSWTVPLTIFGLLRHCKAPQNQGWVHIWYLVCPVGPYQKLFWMIHCPGWHHARNLFWSFGKTFSALECVLDHTWPLQMYSLPGWPAWNG